MSSNFFKDLMREIQRGMEGRNTGIPMGLHKLNKQIGIRRRIYTLIFGATGSGKTSFVHSAYVLHPFDEYIKSGGRIKLKIILFYQERSKDYAIAKWLSRKIFLDQGFNIPVPKMLGWWETKLTKDEHDIVKMYEDYFERLSEVVTIIEGPQNPTGIYKYLKEFAEGRGHIEEVDKYRKIYHPNEPDEIVIPIVDHMGLLKGEKGMENKKQAIDKASEYLQLFRDLYGYSPIAVSQLTRNLSNPVYKKMESFEPALDDIKESGAPGEAADVILSLFDPNMYKTNDPKYGDVGKFINQETGDNFFRRVKILKNTYGQSEMGIGMAFHGHTGVFKELPKPSEMKEFRYERLFDGSYFLE